MGSGRRPMGSGRRPMREEPPPRAVFPPVMPEPFHPASGAFANEKRRDLAIVNRAADEEWRTDVFPALGEPSSVGFCLPHRVC